MDEKSAQPSRTYDDMLPHLDYFSYRNADQFWVIVPSVIDFHDISYVVGGEASYVVGDRTLILRKGDLLYIPPGTYREAQLTQAQRFEVYAMNFLLRDTGGGPIDRLPFELVTPIGIHPELITLLKSLSTAWLLQETGFRLIVRAYVELIIGKLMDLAVHKNPVSVADLRIRQVIEYITEHYDQPIPLDELAGLVHLSPSYLSVLFHRSMGVKLSHYINIIRVNHAESLLKNNMCNVTEASENCGFCDVYYFSRVFTEIKGYNPKSIIGKRQRFQA